MHAKTHGHQEVPSIKPPQRTRVRNLQALQLGHEAFFRQPLERTFIIVFIKAFF